MQGEHPAPQRVELGASLQAGRRGKEAEGPALGGGENRSSVGRFREERGIGSRPAQAHIKGIVQSSTSERARLAACSLRVRDTSPESTCASRSGVQRDQEGQGQEATDRSWQGPRTAPADSEKTESAGGRDA